MAAHISYTSYDYYPTTIVPVIASFDADGHIKPLFVRIDGESYKIASSWCKYNFRTSIDFTCKIVDSDVLKPLSLTYHMMEGMWTIPK